MIQAGLLLYNFSGHKKPIKKQDIYQN